MPLRKRLESLINMNIHLKAPEGQCSVMLPICKAYSDSSGCPIIVRSAQNNAKTNHARLEQYNGMDVYGTRAAIVIATTAIATTDTSIYTPIYIGNTSVISKKLMISMQR